MNDICYTGENIRISLILSVFNSHEIVRRQIQYLKSLNLPDDFEIIIMDDGSDPPLYFPDHGLKNLNIYKTGITIPWTQPYAKNVAAQIAKGEYLLITDIDHFFPPETMEVILNFKGDKLMFKKRSYAVINSHGRIKDDRKSLLSYGLPERKLRGGRNKVYWHTNTFMMKTEIFRKLGGFKKKYWFDGKHTLEDSHFYQKYKKSCEKMGWQPTEISQSKVLCFPAANADPKNLFHDLSREIAPGRMK